MTSVNYNTVMMEVPHYEDRVIKWKLLLPKMQLFCKRLFIMFSTNTIEEKKVTLFSLQPFISVSWFFSFAVWVCAHMYVYVELKIRTNFCNFCAQSIVLMWSMKAFRTKLTEEILSSSLSSIYIQTVFYAVLKSSF